MVVIDDLDLHEGHICSRFKCSAQTLKDAFNFVKQQVQQVQVYYKYILYDIYIYIITSILQSLYYEKYDVPLLAVSFSYSRRAVV